MRIAYSCSRQKRSENYCVATPKTAILRTRFQLPWFGGWTLMWHDRATFRAVIDVPSVYVPLMTVRPRRAACLCSCSVEVISFLWNNSIILRDLYANEVFWVSRKHLQAGRKLEMSEPARVEIVRMLSSIAIHAPRLLLTADCQCNEDQRSQSLGLTSDTVWATAGRPALCQKHPG